MSKRRTLFGSVIIVACVALVMMSPMLLDGIQAKRSFDSAFQPQISIICARKHGFMVNYY